MTTAGGSVQVRLVPIDAQIGIVERQIEYLLRALPERVRAGKVPQEFADRDLDTWRAVRATLIRERER